MHVPSHPVDKVTYQLMAWIILSLKEKQKGRKDKNMVVRTLECLLTNKTFSHISLSK